MDGADDERAGGGDAERKSFKFDIPSPIYILPKTRGEGLGCPAKGSRELNHPQFDRVKEYATIEPEEKTDGTTKDEAEAEALANHEEYIIPKNWPLSGSVELRNVTIRYQPDGPDILKDVNLKFDAGERVAIVGRTGSGKSTVTSLSFVPCFRLSI